MDRRTFMLTGAWLSTMAGGAWPWFAQAVARGNLGNDMHTLAIVDSTLVCGASFARYAAHLQLPVFETGDDAGALWFTALAPWLGDAASRATPSLIGFTRASDYFVLRHLAIRTGRFVEHSHEPRVGQPAQAAYVAFALTPRHA
ncbi:hypothetical protein G3N58_11730 [Paraburkholderia sp. Ac-20342]|uniref:hypothetical protein n=1 Tax=Paraburkholderia sp. Ac-20342 TaxID=2703889 RepID=UPI00197F1840|nr:hypothetical protein [Paraburkholderia sp. Ac-20342]MBN3847494.1 hypothetical protein [Paraburkholderia sp. Ac-20342]